MPHPNGIPTHAELRDIPDHLLAANIDATLSGTVNDFRWLMAQMYRDEIVRREQQRAADTMAAYTQQMNALTRQIRNLTVVILVATIISIAVVAWPR